MPAPAASAAGAGLLMLGAGGIATPAPKAVEFPPVGVAPETDGIDGGFIVLKVPFCSFVMWIVAGCQLMDARPRTHWRKEALAQPHGLHRAL